MNDKKIEFIKNEVWMLSIAAAFQHISVYNSPETKGRKELRENLKRFVQGMVEQRYRVAVPGGQHLRNIEKIQAESEKWKEANLTFHFSFGVAQKLLNLYLKYLWCLGLLENDPPHFPVDSIIIKELSKEGKSIHMDKIDLDNTWSQFESKEPYLKVINYAKELKKRHPDHKDKSLAEIELELYRRR